MSLKNFRLYQLAIQFLSVSAEITEGLPRGNAEIKDQLKRASLSVVFNIAEGAGCFSSGQQQYHYMIARGSAFECYAAIDAIKVLGLCRDPEREKRAEIINEIIFILTRLCGKRAGRRRGGEGGG